MTNKTSQMGSALIIVIVLAVVTALGGGYYLYQKQIKEDAQMEEKAMMEQEAMEKKDDGAMMEKKEGDSMMAKYTGTVLAGKLTPLLDFTQADYDTALKSDKLIVLYFYADWCPICRAEIPHLYGVFNELTTDKVVGFRVNYNDNETDNDEKGLAREHGVAYQHTKIFVKNGTRILKAPDTWDLGRYLSEINKAL